MQNTKRLFSILLIIILTCSLALTSCAPKGEIKKAKTTPAEEEDKSGNHFTRIKSPFKYSYTTVKNSKAHVSFDVPSSWTVVKNNSRFITLQAPTNDANFPNGTFQILWNYTVQTSDKSTKDDIRLHDAFYYTDFFAQELSGLKYYIPDGSQYCIRYYEGEDTICPAPSFIGDYDASCKTLITDNIDIMNKDTADMGPSGYGYALTLVRWNGIPVSISSIVPTANTDNARKMEEYIVSTFKYLKHTFNSTKNVSASDTSFSIPSEFEALSDATNIFVSPATEFYSTSGMAIGTFEVDKTKSEPLTKDNLVSDYAGIFAELFCQDTGHKYSKQGAPQDDGSISYTGYTGKNKEAYSCCYYYVSESDPEIYAGSIYGSDELGCMDIFTFEKGNSQKIIVVAYEKCQKELAQKIDKLILSSYHH